MLNQVIKSDSEFIVPLVDLRSIHSAIDVEIRRAINAVIESERYILGPEGESFEKALSAYCNSRYAFGVSSGTDAITLALMAIGIQQNDEIITSAYSFYSTAGAIARLGGKPVFVDIDPGTFNLDIRQVSQCINPRTKAILPVHLFGQMADMDYLVEIANEKRLYLIEDAAQAIGSKYKGKHAGTIGHLGCFSFYPTKNLGGLGDGGMVITDDEELATRIRLLRNHGFSPKYVSRILGGNFRLDELQAAVLRVKLKYLDQWTQHRQDNASNYFKLFKDRGIGIDNNLVLPRVAVHGSHVYNQFVIRVQLRDMLATHLKTKRIGTEIYYPVPLHLQQSLSFLGYQEGQMPMSELAAKTTLALPIYPGLTYTLQQYVVDAIAEFMHATNRNVGVASS